MSSNPSVIRVYGDVLDYLLAAHGETKEQWEDPFDDGPIQVSISRALYESGLNHDQIDMVKEEILDARLHILIGIFAILFKNGYHPKRVVRNVFKLAKLYCPESVKKLSHSDLAILTSDTISASSMRTHACNQYLDTMTPEQVKALVDKYGEGALHKLAQLSWKSRKERKKQRKKKTTPAKSSRPRQQQLNLDL